MLVVAQSEDEGRQIIAIFVVIMSRAKLKVALLLTATSVRLATSAPEYIFNPREIRIIHPQPPSALPQNAPADHLRWQPALDFDQDSCYNVPAVDAHGTIAHGLYHHFAGLSSRCRSVSDLTNNNVYSRRRCNNGWCAYLYDYYFEKDVMFPWFLDFGHRHDWEHIVVWVKDEAIEYVAVSAHGKYEVTKARDVRWKDEHPLVVYHKDGIGTHSFRLARDTDEVLENASGDWFRGALVSYEGLPEHVAKVLFSHDFGKAIMAIKDSKFSSNLEKAMPDGISFNVEVDKDYDNADDDEESKL